MARANMEEADQVTSALEILTVAGDDTKDVFANDAFAKICMSGISKIVSTARAEARAKRNA